MIAQHDEIVRDIVADIIWKRVLLIDRTVSLLTQNAERRFPRRLLADDARACDF